MALIACILGAVSHFYPIPFPKNKPLLALCVAGYLVCAVAYYYIERYLEGEAFYLTKANSVSKLKDFQCLRFVSELDNSSNPGECFYKLKVSAEGTGNQKGQKMEVERSYKVTEVYDEGGYMHRQRVKEMFEETM